MSDKEDISHKHIQIMFQLRQRELDVKLQELACSLFSMNLSHLNKRGNKCYDSNNGKHSRIEVALAFLLILIDLGENLKINKTSLNSPTVQRIVTTE